jgi:hypothetical protein
MRINNGGETTIPTRPDGDNGPWKDWAKMTLEEQKKSFSEAVERRKLAAKKEAEEAGPPKGNRRWAIKKVVFAAIETVLGATAVVWSGKEIDEYIRTSEESGLHLGDWVSVDGHPAMVVFGMLPESPIKKVIDKKDGVEKIMAHLAVWGVRQDNDPTSSGWYPVSEIYKHPTSNAQPEAGK